MLIKAASHLRPFIRLPFQSPTAPHSLPSGASLPSSLPPQAFTSNATLAASQSASAQHAAFAVGFPGDAGLGFVSNQAAGAGGSGFHAGSSRFSGYTGYGRALLQTTPHPSSAQSSSRDEDDDLQNPNSRAQVLSRARAHRPSITSARSAVLPIKSARSKRFNEAGPDVRFVDLPASPTRSLRLLEADGAEGMGIEERPARERRSSFSSFGVEQIWSVGLGQRQRRRRADVGREEGMLVRAMSTRSVGSRSEISTREEVEMEMEMAENAVMSKEVLSPIPRPFTLPTLTVRPVSSLSVRKPGRAGRSRANSTGSMESQTTTSTATGSREANIFPPMPSNQTKLEAVTQEMRAELEARERNISGQLLGAIRRNDKETVMAMINAYRNPASLSSPGMPITALTTPPYFTRFTYNLILEAMLKFRTAGDPISPILATYNEMLERDILPNQRTYELIIESMILRDAEVQLAVERTGKKEKWAQWDQDTHVARAMIQTPRTHELEQLKKHVELLKEEDNFGSAKQLCLAAFLYCGNRPFSPAFYLKMMEACGKKGDVELAQSVYKHFQSIAASQESQGAERIYKPRVFMSAALIAANGRAGRLDGVMAAYEEFKKTELEGGFLDGRIATQVAEATDSVTDVAMDQEQQTPTFIKRTTAITDLYDALIHALVRCGAELQLEALVSEMKAIGVTSGSTQTGMGPGETIPYTRHMAKTLVAAYVSVNNTSKAAEIAIEWDQSNPSNQFADSTRAMILDRAILNQDFNTANLMYRTYSGAEVYTESAAGEIQLRRTLQLCCKLLEQVESSSEQAECVFETMVFLAKERYRQDWIVGQLSLVIMHLDRRGRAQDILDIIFGKTPVLRKCLDHLARQAITRTVESTLANGAAPAFDTLLAYVLICPESRIIQGAVIESYVTAVSNGEALDLSHEQWITLLQAFTAFGGESADSLPMSGAAGDEFDKHLLGVVAAFGQAQKANEWQSQTLSRWRSIDGLTALLQHRLGTATAIEVLKDVSPPSVQRLQQESQRVSSPVPSEMTSAGLPDPSSTSTDMTPPLEQDSFPPKQYHIDPRLSASIDMNSRPHHDRTPLAAFETLRTAMASPSDVVYVPHPSAVARLLPALARLGEESKVREAYAIAHHLVASALLPNHQLQEWFLVEDSMLMACCQLGHLEEAGLHRAAILDQGGAPSADSYASMISNAKDTTDDSSVARELFAESQQLGVRPTLYLYNTIISKLSRARKAENALELFVKMKQEGIKPSAVTYGAVINACCRVGDAESAATLFNEMQSMPNFKPRVPPYNTMMQLHLQTRPSRDLVLHYYNQLVQANVSPSAHTYKLLLDAYGTLQPIDIPAMQKVFANLVGDPDIPVQGTHWTSLIHAYGIVQGNIDLAEQTFNSIPSHPSTRRNAPTDAICWEAILNVFATHQRIDKLDEYVERMRREHAQGTAYVNNMLIKGYASVGRIEDARKVFESMGDSITGVAAPNNHPTLLTSSGQAKPTTKAPTSIIYREPSTYDAMIRAELKAGSREFAELLVARMEDRHYPAPVTQKIRSILSEATHDLWLSDGSRTFGTFGARSTEEAASTTIA